MAANETVRHALLEMGVEPAKALHASQRYETAEAAINWVFGEGESWEPDNAWLQGAQMGHHSPMRYPSPVEDPPPRSTITLGSNNPFLNPAPVETPKSPTALSRKMDEERNERERSVRASAPPPDGEEGEVGPVFGPTDKDDKDGKMTVTVAAPDTSNKEEEDFQRAIKESMMTASFHSESPQLSMPPPSVRESDAPVVYATSASPLLSAHMLQALSAVPQVRDVVTGLAAQGGNELGPLRSVLVQTDDNITDSYILVDEELSALHRFSPSMSLPPDDYVKNAWIADVEVFLEGALRARLEADLMDMEEDSSRNYAFKDFEQNPPQLLGTVLRSSPESRKYVTMERSMSEPNNIHDQLAKVMWAPDAPGESIDLLADVIFVSVRRTPGVAAPKWEFDHEVVLDRYLTENAVWATQERAGQGVIQGELRRLKDRMDSLATFRGLSLSDALSTAVKELSVQSDEAKEALKAKLERVSEALTAKHAALQQEAQEKEEKLKGTSFETDDPARNQHNYILRAILWHDGFNTPGSHLYAYVHHNGYWWRISDLTATKVDWATIEADNTGQFTDGGPYLLVYSRDGPRPPPPPSAPIVVSSGSSMCEVSMDGSSIEEAMDISPSKTPPPYNDTQTTTALLNKTPRPAGPTSSNLIDLSEMDDRAKLDRD